MDTASKVGMIKKRGNIIKTWDTYFTVLSGAYIYFYKDQSDALYYSYHCIKDAIVE